jgi:hypothetical protein
MIINTTVTLSHQQQHQEQHFYEIHDTALRTVGSTWFYDSIFLFAFPPLALVSLVGNLISYKIFSSPYFLKKPLYTYLKVNCLNSAAIDLIYACSFLVDSRRIVSFANTEFASFLKCYVKLQLVLFAYSYGCALDIVLALERLSELTNMKHQFNRFRPTFVCAWLFLACLVLNAPFVFVFEPKQRTLYNNSTNSSSVFYFYGETRFAAFTTSGSILKNVHYFVRDICTLVLLLAINLVSLVLFRRSYSLNVATQSATRRNSVLMINLKGNEDKRLLGKRKVGVGKLSLMEFRARRVLYFSVAKVNTMLTKMVFIICAFATLEHIFLILALQLFTAYSQPVLFKFDMFFFSDLSIFVKHSINFLIYYTCNKIFKRRFLNMFPRFVK